MRQTLFSKTLLKRTATIMAAVLFYETIAVPLAQAAVIAPPTPKTSPALSIFNDRQTNLTSKNFKEAFSMPTSVGTLAENYAPSTAGRLIYHFQDVHNNVPAQTNLSEMVSLLEMYARKQGKNLVVAVEGVTGPVDSDAISSLPNQKNKEDVGSALLRAGYLMGEEYAAITNAPGRIKLVGIETPSYYQRNVAARANSRVARLNVLAAIKETRSQLEKLKRHNFSVLLTTLEEKRLGVDAGTESLTDYATFLANTNSTVVAAYPQLSRLVHVNVIEKNVDFGAVEKESQSLVAELTLANNSARVEKMMQDAEALKNGQLSALSYYSGLLQQTHKSYPTLEKYVIYLRAADGIDADSLFDEVMQAEAQVAHKLIRHPLAQQLYDHLRWIENAEKFFSLNLIPQEWAQEKSTTVDSVEARLVDIRSFINEQQMDLGYRFEEPVLNSVDLSQAVEGASAFYEAASSRNAVMLGNLENVLKENPASESIVVFITGGFHTPTMTKMLRAKGLAYEVFRPQLDTEVQLSTDLNVSARKVDYLRPVEPTSIPAAREAEIAAVKDPSETQIAAEQIGQLLVPGPDGGNGSGGGAVLTPVLTPEQEANVTNAAKAYGIDDTANKAYMSQMLLQAQSTDDKQLKIKLRGNAAAGNFLPDSLMSKSQRAIEMGLLDYDSIVEASRSNSQRSANLKKTQVVLSGMDAGLGENFGRQKYLAWLNEQGLTPIKTLGAKATDLRVSVQAKNGKTYELSVAEIKILQAIRLAESKEIGQVAVQPLVSDESRPSYVRLLDQTYFFDEIDDSIPAGSKRTYRAVLSNPDSGLALSDFVLQQKLPGLLAGDAPVFPEASGGYSQAGGHGQFGFIFFYEALRKIRENLFDASRNYIRVFMNSDNPNSRADAAIVDNMVANNHVIYMLVTAAESIDKKGGKLGIRYVDVDGKSVPVTDMMEVKQAKAAGQEQEFYALGQEGGLGTAGAQSFNTNILYINEKLLGSILNELAAVLGNGNDSAGDKLLAQAFSATRIPPSAPKMKDGQAYLPLDGAIGSVLLNLNAYFLTSTNPKVQTILSSRGIDRILHLVNVPRVQFFTPNKVPTDHYLFNFSDRYAFDAESLGLVDQNPGAPQPEIVLESKDAAGKDTGFYSDLKDLVDNLGNKLGARELRTLKISGQVSLVNATLKGDVKIFSEIPTPINLYEILPLTDGRLILENKSIVIHADRSFTITSINTDSKQFISSRGTLRTAFISALFGLGVIAAALLRSHSSWTPVVVAIGALFVIFPTVVALVIYSHLQNSEEGWFQAVSERTPLSKLIGKTAIAPKNLAVLQRFSRACKMGIGEIFVTPNISGDVALNEQGQKEFEIPSLKH